MKQESFAFRQGRFNVVFLVQGFGVYSLLMAFAIRYLVAFLCTSLPVTKPTRSQLARQTFRYWSAAALCPLRWDRSDDRLLSIERRHQRLASWQVCSSVLALQGCFEMGEKLPRVSMAIPGSVVGVLMPAFSHLYALKDGQGLKRLYLRSCRYISMMSGLILGFLVPFAPTISMCWLGYKAEYAIVPVAIAALSIPSHFHIITGPASAIFKSTRKPHKELLNAIPRLAAIVQYWFIFDKGERNDLKALVSGLFRRKQVNMSGPSSGVPTSQDGL